MPKPLPERISIAPMLEWTDRHYRYFMRQITKQTLLYSEMIVADAVIHGVRDKLLAFNPLEQPLVVQLGGSEAQKLVTAAQICQEYGYREINLNCGCPSDKVQAGSFGACLMATPNTIITCLNAMQEAVDIPITIKHRIGLNYNYDYDYLANFVHQLKLANCQKIIVHARNAILNGLSPKQNREIPPLRYDYVYQLKRDFPQLQIILNGGISDCNAINQHLTLVDGVMLGREAYYNPYLFATFDHAYFATPPQVLSRKQIALNMLPYLENLLSNNQRLHAATRHMLGLYHACKQAKHWRQNLSTTILTTNSLIKYQQLVESMDE